MFVDHTTASAEVARQLHAEAKKRGFDFVDAPVSGGQAGAENGVLTVMCGGDAAPYGRAEPVIAAYARMCKLLGPSGSGQLAKMVNQICIAGLVQGLAEGIHFAKKAGLDIEALIATISKGAAQSWQMENRYKTMTRRQVRFRLRRRLDAQGPVDLHRRGAAERREPAGRSSGRSVLCRGAEDGRQPLGYVGAAGAARSLSAMDGVRKILFVQERVLAESGSPAAMLVTRVAGIAVLKNPYAGAGYVADLSPLFDVGKALGERIMPEVVRLLGGASLSYGKAAIVGVNGDQEHGAAVIHPKLGARCAPRSAAARPSSAPM